MPHEVVGTTGVGPHAKKETDGCRGLSLLRTACEVQYTLISTVVTTALSLLFFLPSRKRPDAMRWMRRVSDIDAKGLADTALESRIHMRRIQGRAISTLTHSLTPSLAHSLPRSLPPHPHSLTHSPPSLTLSLPTHWRTTTSSHIQSSDGY